MTDATPTADVQFDATQLTLGEIAFIEQYAEQPLSALSDEHAPKGKVLAGMAYVINKRKNVKYTIAAAEKLTLAEATALIGGESEGPKES